MPTLIWAILCLDSSIDRERNNISLFQVVDQLNVPREATTHADAALQIRLQLVFLLRRDKSDLAKNEYPIVLEQIAPDGKTIGRGEMTAEFPQGKCRLRLVVKYEGIKISGAGTYIFRISMKTPHGLTLLGETPLDVETNPA